MAQKKVIENPPKEKEQSVQITKSESEELTQLALAINALFHLVDQSSHDYGNIAAVLRPIEGKLLQLSEDLRIRFGEGGAR
jgi:hypothetical protein